MNKEQFIKRMELIQKFLKEQEVLGDLINKLTDSLSVVSMGDFLVSEMTEMINESMSIKDETLLSWWLFENVEKVIYIDKVKVDVSTLEKLYDYIITYYG